MSKEDLQKKYRESINKRMSKTKKIDRALEGVEFRKSSVEQVDYSIRLKKK